jgi:glutamyl-tRNA reductase
MFTQSELPALQLTYFPMSEMSSAIGAGDIIYPCTASATPLITPTHITEILDHRHKQHPGHHMPLRFIDISVPRNVHPDCGTKTHAKSESESHGEEAQESDAVQVSEERVTVECFNVDDLKELVEKNLFKRKREVIDAEMILRDEILKYELWKENLGTLPMIEKLQNKAEEVRLQELSKVLEKLNTLTNEELGVVNSLSKGIVSTLLRGPLLHLRKQKALDSTKLAITQLQAAFQLE